MIGLFAFDKLSSVSTSVYATVHVQPWCVPTWGAGSGKPHVLAELTTADLHFRATLTPHLTCHT
jgi:hypothetical protein